MPLFIGDIPVVAVNIGEVPLFAIQLAAIDTVDDTAIIPLQPADRLIAASGEFLVTQLAENLITAQDIQLDSPASRFTTAAAEFLVTQLDENLRPIQEF